MNQIANSLLSAIADILFYPVLFALVLSLIWIVYQAGMCVREWWQRSQNSFVWLNAKQNSLEKKVNNADKTNLDIELEKILDNAEREGNRKLNSTRFSIRSGPTLGLMGTLIPMAEALMGLSKGNLPALASNSSTAFATTVLGLAVGLIAYTLTTIKEKWIKADLKAITFKAEELLRNSNFKLPNTIN
jgi:biopolymer transport protein ExbB/TolQ